MKCEAFMDNMPQSVFTDMQWSTRLFNEQVWPLISPILGGGSLLQMEGRPDVELARILDMNAGIDGWHVHNIGMRGIASRIQITKDPFDTFTIRMSRDSGASTEFEKRSVAIDGKKHGWIYPALTVQAYAASENGPILSCGVGRTSEIIEFIKRDLHGENRTTNAVFAVCSWRSMKRHGYEVKILKPDAATPGLSLVKGKYQARNQQFHATACAAGQ